MNPRNLGDNFNVKFLKSRRTPRDVGQFLASSCGQLLQLCELCETGKSISKLEKRYKTGGFVSNFSNFANFANFARVLSLADFGFARVD